MSVRQYIGARYVPKIYENSLNQLSADWEASVSYEPLTVVTYNNSSYISKKEVPANIGNPAANSAYWTNTGNYNGLISNIQNQVNDIDTRVTNLEGDSKRIIMLGDSYGNRINSDGKTYFTLIAEALGLTSADFYHNNVAGASFKHSNPQGEFIYLLTQLAGSVSDPDTITDILVVCGANDANQSYADTLSAISSFSTYCKTSYKNAKVSIMGLGLTFTNTICTILRDTTIPAFRAASAYGVKFIENSQYVLRDSTLLESDNCHPNAAGVDKIANVCIDFFNTGEISVHRSIDFNYDANASFEITLSPDHSANVVNEVINTTVLDNNGVMKLYAKGANGTITFNSNINITMAASDHIICKLPRRIFYGYTPTGSAFIYNDAKLVNMTNYEVIPLVGYIRADSSNITIEFILKTTAANAGYQYYIEFTPELIQ